MSVVLTAADPAADMARSAGGKAEALHRLTRHGLPVPDWAVICVDALEAFRRTTGLEERIGAALAGLRPDGTERAAAAIAEAFAGTPLDERALDTVRRAYERIGEGAVAVRSSGVDEDRRHLSFAGQYATFLNVTGLEAVAGRVRDCWASAYSARSLTYRLLHGLPAHPPGMAVILQRMVPAETSGVLFTADPVTGRRDELVVSAAFGLGEALVSGGVDADTVVVDRRDGTVRHSVVGDKRERLDPLSGGSGVTVTPVAVEHRARPALEAADLARLRACAERIEELFGVPQDIEWAIAAGTLWILQSRPVSGLPRPQPTGEVRVWDNSNIIESFGEVVSPLTFSFARHAYRRVYQDHCALLGVPRADLERLGDTFGALLGRFDGRVYYNVLNWYKIIRLLPGYGLHRRLLAAATGVRETSGELADQQHPIDSRWRERLVRVRVGWRFGWAVLTLRRRVARFIDGFDRAYSEFDAIEYSGMSGECVDRLLGDLERRLLARWGGTAVLDTVVMLSAGVLHLLTRRWLPDAPEGFLWEAVRVGDSGVVESAAPTRRLTALARAVAARPALAARVRDLDPPSLWDWTQDTGVPDGVWLRGELDHYLRDFGCRGADELKLEEPDLHDDPSPLTALLKDALARHETEASVPATASETEDGSSADAYLDRHLRGPRRWAYERVRAKTRQALRERERVRFARTRAFGLVRRMVKAIGEDMERAGVLADRGDVFFLELEEIRAVHAGTLDHRELGALAALRRDQHARQRRMPAPPARFVTRGGLYWSRIHPDVPQDDEQSEVRDDAGDEVLRGTPCCPGTRTARARVLDRPGPAGGAVVVAYRTDPGWVGVLASAAALLIERGSPLSHVAIVARELGVPTVVRIPGLTRRVRTSTVLTVDGARGTVRIKEGPHE